MIQQLIIEIGTKYVIMRKPCTIKVNVRHNIIIILKTTEENVLLEWLAYSKVNPIKILPEWHDFTR